MSRIADTLTNEAVKVLQCCAGGQRIDVVLVVEQVEYLELGNSLKTLSKVERSGKSKVESEVGVVLAQEVPSAIDVGATRTRAQLNAIESLAVAAERSGPGRIGIGTGRLSAMRLHAHVKFETCRQFGIRNEVEFVLFVAIGVGILLGEIEEVQVAEAERVSLVGIVVQVFGPDIICLKLEPIAEALAHANGCAAIERLCGTGGVGDGAQVPERRRLSVRWAASEVNVSGGDQIR